MPKLAYLCSVKKRQNIMKQRININKSLNREEQKQAVNDFFLRQPTAKKLLEAGAEIKECSPRRRFVIQTADLQCVAQIYIESDHCRIEYYEDEREFTLKEVARQLNVTPDRCRQLVGDGQLAATKRAGAWYVRSSDLAAYTAGKTAAKEEREKAAADKNREYMKEYMRQKRKKEKEEKAAAAAAAAPAGQQAETIHSPAVTSQQKEEEEKEEKKKKPGWWSLVWRFALICPMLMYMAIFRRDVPSWMKKILEKAEF